jgi:uncharacterized ParB-like nuclease family protein
MAKKKQDIKVHLATMVDAMLLTEHPNNSNKQSRHISKELAKSIKENGYDEPLIVVKRSDGDVGYYVASGNHRFRTGMTLGMTEFPCIVRDDWDSIKSQVELVRRNYVRGDINKDAFTEAVNNLAQESSMDFESIRTLMGFEDADKFAALYKEDEEANREMGERIAGGGAPGGGANIVKVIDDLGAMIASLLERFGDTVPNSFLIVPVSSKNHMFIMTTPGLKKVLELIATQCVQKNMDINVVMSGLLNIGMAHSAFKTDTPDTKMLATKGVTKGEKNLKSIHELLGTVDPADSVE